MNKPASLFTKGKAPPIPTNTKHKRTMTSANVNLIPEPQHAEEAGLHLARSATRAAVELHDKVDEMAAGILSNPMLHPNRAKVDAAVKVKESAKSILKRFDQAEAQIADEIDRVAVKMQAAERLEPEQNYIASEIRAHIKTLSLKEQRKLVAQAQQDGDTLTLKALASAPAYLSGMTEGAVISAAVSLHDPDTLARMNRMVAAREQLPSNRKMFESKVAQYWNTEVEALIAAAAAAKV